MVQSWYQQELDRLAGEHLYRQLRTVDSPMDRIVTVEGGSKIVFCSNNYLGLAHDSRVIQAAQKALEQWGMGGGGSRLICGHSAAHQNLENRLASWLGKQSCLIFPSGYQTNLAVLTPLAQQGDLILADKLVHASILDGAQSSDAECRVWPHGNVEKLRRLLDRGGYKRAYIITDSVFSMDGDCADLKELVHIKKQYGAMLIVDEAHALGCLGPEGKGLAEATGLLDEIDLYIATFSKAFGGAGGFVAGDRDVIDYLMNRARPFIYSTAIPPAQCAAVEAALDIIHDEPNRRLQLQENANSLRKSCKTLGLNIGSSNTHIVPVILGSAERVLACSDFLWQAGYWVAAVRPPTVAKGASRLRISLICDHQKEDIEGLCNALNDFLKKTSTDEKPIT